MLGRWQNIPAFVGVVMLGGCGLLVPEVRDFPNNRSTVSNNLLVQAIIVSIHCELEDAVTQVINDDAASAKENRFYYARFLRNWGAEVALTLTLDEKSVVNPTGIYGPLSPLTPVFTLSGGLSATAEATRVDKVNYYYKVSELYLGPNRKCERDTNPPRDSLLIQSDLKLYEWLSAMINGTATGIITSVSNQNVLSHEITFDIVTTGTLNPAWTLVRGSIDQGTTTLLTGSRDRKHDLLVTFGPLDKSQSGTFLTPIAEQTHISSQLISGIANGSRTTSGR